MLSLLYGPSLTSLPATGKNDSFDNRDPCWQSDAFALKYTDNLYLSFQGAGCLNFLAAVIFSRDYSSELLRPEVPPAAPRGPATPSQGPHARLASLQDRPPDALCPPPGR